MEAMQERIDEFKAKGEKAQQDGGGKGDHDADGKSKPQLMCDVVEDEFETAATKTVEDLTKLLEGSNSDEELSIDEATEDLGNKVKSEVNDSEIGEMVDQDMRRLESLANKLDTTQKDWSETKVKLSLKKKIKLKRNARESRRETECKLCHLKVAQACNLKRHMKNKHKNEPLQQQPSEINNSEVDQIEDQQTLETTTYSDESLVFFCDFCNLAFTSEGLLNEHIESNHPGQEICNIEYVPENYEEDGTENEEPKPTNDNKFMKKCDLCPKMLKRSTYDWKIQFHMRRAHGKHESEKKSTRVAQCKLCYREYRGNASKKNLRRHEVSAHKDELGLLDMDAALRWPCTRCELKFISNNVLDVHMNYAHRERDLEQVELLAKEGDFNDETVADEVDMDIDVDKLYPENVSTEFVCCKKDFVTLKKLKKHKSNVHGSATFVGLNV